MTNNQDIVPGLAAGQHVGTHVHINAARRFSFVWLISNRIVFIIYILFFST